MASEKQLLEGRAVVITGAGQGIGRAAALEMAARGAAVAVNDIEAALADTVVGEIKNAGGRAVAAPGSVADPETAAAIVGAALSAFGRLDGLINNAGILRDRMFKNMSVDEWDAVIAVHLRGAFCMSRAAVDAMKDSGGAIVNLTSTAGMRGNFGQANYATAKAGLLGFTKTLSMELGKLGIRVNALAPGAKTRMTLSIPEEVIREKAKSDPKYARLLKLPPPEAVAPLLAWLVSDEARDVTGRIFYCSGNRLGMWSFPQQTKIAYAPTMWDIDLIRERIREELLKD